jgi:hypothetical protein
VFALYIVSLDSLFRAMHAAAIASSPAALHRCEHGQRIGMLVATAVKVAGAAGQRRQQQTHHSTMTLADGQPTPLSCCRAR